MSSRKKTRISVIFWFKRRETLKSEKTSGNNFHTACGAGGDGITSTYEWSDENEKENN